MKLTPQVIRKVARELEQRADEFNVGIRVGYWGTVGREDIYRAVETPRSFLLPVCLAKGIRVSAFRHIAEDLVQSATGMGLKLEIGNSEGRLFVEILKDDKDVEPLYLTAEYLRGLDLAPFTGVIGESFASGDAESVFIDFSDPETPHLSFSGMTGRGKTTALRGFILSLAYSTPPTDLQLVLLDPKTKNLRPLENLPHVILKCYKQEDIAACVRYVHTELIYRQEHPDERRPKLVFVVDELLQVMNNPDKEVKRMLVEIAGIGREPGVHIVTATPRPLASNIDGDFVAQMVRVVGCVSKASESSYLSGEPDPSLMHLGVGSFVIVRHDRRIRFQSYLPMEADIIVAIQARAPKMLATKPIAVTELPQAPTKFSVESDLALTKDLILKMWDPAKGGLRHGGRKRFAELLGTAPGGSTDTRYVACIGALRKMKLLG